MTSSSSSSLSLVRTVQEQTSSFNTLPLCSFCVHVWFLCAVDNSCDLTSFLVNYDYPSFLLALCWTGSRSIRPSWFACSYLYPMCDCSELDEDKRIDTHANEMCLFFSLSSLFVQQMVLSARAKHRNRSPRMKSSPNNRISEMLIDSIMCVRVMNGIVSGSSDRVTSIGMNITRNLHGYFFD